MTPPRGAAPFIGIAMPVNNYAEVLRFRIAAADQLCTALFQWITLDLKAQLQACEHPPTYASPELLVQYREQLEQLQTKKQTMETVLGKLAKDQPDMAELLRLSLPDFDAQISSTEQALSAIQANLERPQS